MTDGRDRRDVAIANSSHSHNGPIYGRCQVGELRVGNGTLHHEHQCPQAGDQYQHKEEINGYLGEALLERMHQDIAFIDEAEQFKYTEDTDEAERTQQNHVAGVGQEEGKVWRQGGQ